MSKAGTHGGRRGRKGPPWASAGVSAAVAAVAAAHLLFPGRIDATFLALLALALVPWLAPFVESIRIDRVRIRFRRLERELAETRGEARGARRVAETVAEGVLTGGGGRAGRGDAAGAADDSDVPPDEEFAALVAEYKSVQKSTKPGPAKTGRLTRVMSRMIVLGPRLRSLDVAAALRGKDGGKRIAAYAVLYARPDGALLGDLVDALTGHAQRAFSQFWGIKAAGKVLPAADPAEARAAVFRLEQFLQRQLPPGTDRHRELSIILRGFAGGQISPGNDERRGP